MRVGFVTWFVVYLLFFCDGRCLHLAGWQFPCFRLGTGLEGDGYCSLQVSPFVFGLCYSVLEVESHDPGLTQSGK